MVFNPIEMALEAPPGHKGSRNSPYNNPRTRPYYC